METLQNTYHKLSKLWRCISGLYILCQTVLLKENGSFNKWVSPKVDKVFISGFYIVETF